MGADSPADLAYMTRYVQEDMMKAMALSTQFPQALNAKPRTKSQILFPTGPRPAELSKNASGPVT